MQPIKGCAARGCPRASLAQLRVLCAIPLACMLSSARDSKLLSSAHDHKHVVITEAQKPPRRDNIALVLFVLYSIFLVGTSGLSRCTYERCAAVPISVPCLNPVLGHSAGLYVRAYEPGPPRFGFCHVQPCACFLH